MHQLVGRHNQFLTSLHSADFLSYQAPESLGCVVDAPMLVAQAPKRVIGRVFIGVNQGAG